MSGNGDTKRTCRGSLTMIQKWLAAIFPLVVVELTSTLSMTVTLLTGKA
jgi:hypothetical protein